MNLKPYGWGPAICVSAQSPGILVHPKVLNMTWKYAHVGGTMHTHTESFASHLCFVCWLSRPLGVSKLSVLRFFCHNLICGWCWGWLQVSLFFRALTYPCRTLIVLPEAIQMMPYTAVWSLHTPLCNSPHWYCSWPITRVLMSIPEVLLWKSSWFDLKHTLLQVKPTTIISNLKRNRTN
jgi:hypothetical protein